MNPCSAGGWADLDMNSCTLNIQMSCCSTLWLTGEPSLTPLLIIQTLGVLVIFIYVGGSSWQLFKVLVIHCWMWYTVCMWVSVWCHSLPKKKWTVLIFWGGCLIRGCVGEHGECFNSDCAEEAFSWSAAQKWLQTLKPGGRSDPPTVLYSSVVYAVWATSPAAWSQLPWKPQYLFHPNKPWPSPLAL